MPNYPHPPIDDPAPRDPHVRGREPDREPESTADSPRAFAVRTGQLCQTVGVAFLLGACCLWSFGGRLVQKADHPPEHWTGYLAGDRLPAAILTIDVAATLIGGIGLLAAGIGLCGERPGSGTFAAIVNSVLSLVYWLSCAVLAVKAGSWPGSLTAAAFALVTTALLLLSLHSAAVLRRFPPPADQNVVTEEFIERHSRRHREPGD